MLEEISMIDRHGRTIFLRSRISLEIDGRNVFGEGRARLLRLIRETGSINAASKGMGISFRKAWSILNDMEQALNSTLVERNRGGPRGGCSTLTPLAVDLLNQFEKIIDGLGER